MYSNFKMKKYRYSSVSRTAKKPLVFYNKYREAISSLYIDIIYLCICMSLYTLFLYNKSLYAKKQPDFFKNLKIKI